MHSFAETEPLPSELSKIATYFDEWKNEIEATIAANGRGNVDSVRAEYCRRLITKECYKDVLSICKGVPELLRYLYNELGLTISFCLKSISQDLLKRDFSVLRASAGTGTNPTVYSAMFSMRSMNLAVLDTITQF